MGHGLCIFSIRSHGSLWVGNSNKIEFLMTCSLVFNWKNLHNANFTVIGVGLISLLHLIACLLNHENGQIKNQISSMKIPGKTNKQHTKEEEFAFDHLVWD